MFKIDSAKLAMYNNVGDATSEGFTLENIKQFCEIMERISKETKHVMVGYGNSYWCPKCDTYISVKMTEVCSNCQQELSWSYI